MPAGKECAHSPPTAWDASPPLQFPATKDHDVAQPSKAVYVTVISTIAGNRYAYYRHLTSEPKTLMQQLAPRRSEAMHRRST